MKDGTITYFRFLVLPFGLSSDIFTKLTRPLIHVAKWRREVNNCVMFLDDGFGSADTYLTTENIGTYIRGELLAAGFIPKADK